MHRQFLHHAARVLLILGCGVLLCRQAWAQVPLTAVLLSIETNGSSITLTWTNEPSVHLLESTNMDENAVWRISTRQPEYFGGWLQVTLSNTPTSRPRFFRLLGTNELETALHINLVERRIPLRWRAEPEGFRLEQSFADTAPYEWTQVDAAPELMEGYKRLRISVNENPQIFFRVTAPLNHVLIVGQSLAIGGEGLPLLSTQQPYGNRMFKRSAPVTGTVPEEDFNSLVPLVEETWPPLRIGETIASGFANWVSWREGIGVHDLLVSNSGRGGQPYANLKRGTEPYTQATNQIAAGFRLRRETGYKPRAVFAVHGEADAANPAYDTDIRGWQTDLEQDIRQITGSSSRIPMFHSQVSYTRTLTQFALLAEHERNPSATVLVCPKYFLPYKDGIHLTSDGYRWLGEYYAKAYHQQVLQGRTWSPLRPGEIERSTNVIKLSMTGVVDRLVLDTNSVLDPAGHMPFPIRQEFPYYFTLTGRSNSPVVALPTHSLNTGDALLIFAEPPPGGPTPSEYRVYFVQSVIDDRTIQLSTNAGGTPLFFTDTWTVNAFTPVRTVVGPYGFEYYDEVGGGIPWRCSTWVTGVELAGVDQVRITLNQTPTGNDRRLRYAYSVQSPTQGPLGGPQTGPRGCLRDADPTPSQYGYTLYNWCVHFEKPCP